jgi:ABC-2 type transport system permease protein
MSPGALWQHLSLFRMFVLLLYHLLTVHAFWWAPFYGWLLMVSAWSRRMPILWALLPPVAIAVVEKIAFNSTHFLHLLQSRFASYDPGSVSTPMPGMFPTHPMTQMTPLHFLANPDLWTGLAITTVFLWVAVWLRQHREPI